MESKIARKIQRNRAHDSQLELLLAYMEDHSEFAKGHITNLGASGKVKHKQMWNDLANDLNRTGPVTKSATAWGKTWRVIKNAAKKKRAQHTVQMKSTGNVGPIEPLSDFDDRVTSIFGKYGTGLSVIEESGTPDDPQDVISSNGKKKIRSSQAQLKHLVSFVEDHPHLATDGIGDGKLISNLWEQLTSQLNHGGDIIKDRKGWMKTWTDLTRMAEQRKTLMIAGKRKAPLPFLDKRVLDVINRGVQRTSEKHGGSLAATPITKSPSSLDRHRYSRPSLTISCRSPHRSPYLYTSTIHSPNRFSSFRRSPHRLSSPRRDKISSVCSQDYSVRSPKPTSVHLPKPSLVRSSQFSSVRSPKRSSMRSTDRLSVRSDRHSYPRSPVPSPRRSPVRSPSFTQRSSVRTGMRSPRYSPRHMTSRSLPHRVESPTPGCSTWSSNNKENQQHPKEVPFVDLTRKTTSSGAKQNVLTVIEAIDKYTHSMNKFMKNIVSCLEDQNRILKNGFELFERRTVNEEKKMSAIAL